MPFDQQSHMPIWVTLFIIALSWLSMAAWTVYASFDGTSQNTVSNVSTALMLWAPVLAAALGSVCGHWTWTRAEPALGLDQRQAIWLQFWLIWGAVVLTPILRNVPLQFIFGGYYLSAHFFWPQNITPETARQILPFWG